MAKTSAVFVKPAVILRTPGKNRFLVRNSVLFAPLGDKVTQKFSRKIHHASRTIRSI
jgi:hypothetical protein